MQVLHEDEQPADQVLHLYDASSAWVLATPQPAFLPGSFVEEMDLNTELEGIGSAPTAHGATSLSPRTVSMRGAAMALDLRGNTTASPTAGDTRVPHIMMLPRSTFSLRAQLMHVFVSYRVSSEGALGNGMSGLLAEKMRTLSMDRSKELQIPRQGWGIWPKGAKKPVRFREEQAKVFLDRDCLQDGQSWLAGFVHGSDPSPTASIPNPLGSRSPKSCTLHPAREPCALTQVVGFSSVYAASELDGGR
jgi:hypothetical protein